MNSVIKNYFKTKGKEVYFEICLYLFVLFLPLGWGIDIFLMFLLTLSWVFTADWKNKKLTLLQHKKSFLLIAGIFFIFMLALLYSDDTKTALGRVERALPLLIFPCVLFSVPKEKLSIKKLFFTLGLGIFIAMFISWGHILLDILSKKEPLKQVKYFFKWIYTDWNLLKPLDFQPSYFALYLILFIAVIISMDGFKNLKVKVYWYVSILLLLILFLVETNSRVGFLCFLIILLVNGIKKTNRKVKLIYLGIILVLFMTATQFPYLYNKFYKLFDAQGNIAFERYYRWQEILQIFSEKGNWLVGVGNGDVYEMYKNAYIKGNFTLALEQKYNAHNQYLELLIGTGLLGLGWYLASLIHFIYRTKLKKLAMPFFVLMLFFSFSESILIRSKGILFFSFFYCLFINQYQQVNKKNNG